MTIGNDTEFALYIGVNKSTVSRARKAGRLILTADGRVDFEASITRLNETTAGRTDVAARHAARRGASIPTGRRYKKNATEAHSTDKDAPLDDIKPENIARNQAKAALLYYENQQIKLEIALRRGLRVERASLKREAAGLGAMLRAGIERVIDQTAPRLAAATNDLQRRQILAGEIHRLRSMLKHEMPRALRRMKDTDKATA